MSKHALVDSHPCRKRNLIYGLVVGGCTCNMGPPSRFGRRALSQSKKRTFGTEGGGHEKEREFPGLVNNTGRNPAPPQKPWNDVSPVRTNKHWFPIFQVVQDFVHPQHHRFTEQWCKHKFVLT